MGTRAVVSTRHRWQARAIGGPPAVSSLAGAGRLAAGRLACEVANGLVSRTGGVCGRRKGNSPAEIAVSATSGWLCQTARDPVPGLPIHG